MPCIKPMVISIWCGNTSEPNDLNSYKDNYLRPFVTELSELLEHGVSINDHHITITIRCFICDSPARAFIKGWKEFS